jgi:hypothetical protein
MGRKFRYIPETGALVEVTCRTLQGRPLLRPSPELNDIAAGILGRAQRLYPVDLVAFVLVSNHYHLILWVEDAKRLARWVALLPLFPREEEDSRGRSLRCPSVS